jgi:hypothetical protein
VSWERDGGERYYYSAQKVGGRVVKTYFGRDEPGTMAAQLDEKIRAEKTAARAEQEAIRGVYERAEALALTLDHACQLLLEGSLLAAGYHCPGHRAWRRRRVAHRSQPGPSAPALG